MNDISFFNLLGKDTIDGNNIEKIEVPIIQRDYAQGRQTEDVQRKLADLLTDIKKAVEDHSTLSLNFIYGKTTDQKCFIPMDGQQRLTLLFLLHVYAFFDDDLKTDLLLRFSYDTRDSSRRFVEKLVNRRREIFTNIMDTPEAVIIDSAWFLPQWKHDPTIQSMLVVLNKIHALFKCTPNLATALEDSVITFKFLNMEDLGMEDTLYIKLNARGKALSDFENFRAALIDRVITLGDKSFSDKFKLALDGEWADMIWNEIKGESAVAFDNAFLNIIHNILFNCTLDWKWHGRKNHPSVLETVESSALETLYHTFRFLKDSMRYERILDIPFVAWFKNDSNTPPFYEPTYRQRALLCAVSVYAVHSQGKVDAGFWEWYRIVRNLVFNTTIDRDNFSSIVGSLGKLSSFCGKIVSHFATTEKIHLPGFSLQQVAEEQLKAWLIQQRPGLADIFKNAEAHPYFSGQIGSVLSFAGFAIDDMIDLDSSVTSFTSYWTLFEIFFEDRAPVANGLLLRRALLAFGDYRMPTSGYKTLVIDEREKPTSWKGLLATTKGRNYMKQLFDRLKKHNVTGKDGIETVLKEIISTSKFDEKDWRYYAVICEELLDKDHINHTYWQMREDNGAILLLTTSTSGGYNYELYTSVLDILLKKQGKQCRIVSERGQWAYYWLEGITLPTGEELRVRYHIGHGLVIERNDKEELADPFSGNTVDNVIQYLTDHGY